MVSSDESSINLKQVCCPKSKGALHDPGIFRELKQLEWVENGENLVLMGPPGVGKTHIAIGLGVEAVRKGFTVRFYSAEELIEILRKAEREGTLESRLKEIWCFMKVNG